jgi:hypothetical protein
MMKFTPLIKPSYYQIALFNILFLLAFQVPAKVVQVADTFNQEYAIKYYLPTEKNKLMKVASDRNLRIQLLHNHQLFKPTEGSLLYPGILKMDGAYRFDSLEHFKDLLSYKEELVYLTDKVVYSNAWAGSLYLNHSLAQVKLFGANDQFDFLLTDGENLQLLNRVGKKIWEGKSKMPVIGLTCDAKHRAFWILTESGLFILGSDKLELKRVFEGKELTCFALAEQGASLIVGTKTGYLRLTINDVGSAVSKPIWNRKLPCNELTIVKEIDGQLWFGSRAGAFRERKNGSFDYYFGERWLPGNHVASIAKGPMASILIATDAGLTQLLTKKMTLKQKADFYDKQVRARHIRNGLNATLKGMKHGDLNTGYMSDSDNDGLWTAMYLAAEALRFAVEQDSAALYNCKESLLAMERLYSVNPLIGFPSRSFERIGHKNELADAKVWLDAGDRLWSWKSTTSSDEAIGHIFAFSVLAEVVEDTFIKEKAISLMDSLMSHILDHDLYLVDHDGKATLWGKWHPDYVNQFPVNVGDRKLNSSNIIAMLQSAYHFTKKEKYKEKALELLDKFGYYENLMRPMNEIGKADEHADDKSKLLSERWNHSDDEMYFLGYWGLYRYAFNDTLKANYKKAIIDHWEYERPEKDALWNFFAAMVGEKDPDLLQSRQFLEEYPLDLINWSIQNSHRKDLNFLDDNFLDQTTDVVLSPKERPIHRHNRTMFVLDEEESGDEEYSAGDIWLLPYWLGRYLKVLD